MGLLANARGAAAPGSSSPRSTTERYASPVMPPTPLVRPRCRRTRSSSRPSRVNARCWPWPTVESTASTRARATAPGATRTGPRDRPEAPRRPPHHEGLVSRSRRVRLRSVGVVRQVLGSARRIDHGAHHLRPAPAAWSDDLSPRMLTRPTMKTTVSVRRVRSSMSSGRLPRTRLGMRLPSSHDLPRRGSAQDGALRRRRALLQPARVRSARAARQCPRAKLGLLRDEPAPAGAADRQAHRPIRPTSGRRMHRRACDPL